jgi:glycosyltransferase involved in cell wall biosynthesis
MKILHIVAEVSAESGVAVVATRLAVEQQGLGHQVCVACTGDGEVLKCESSKVLKCCEKLETGNLKLGETLWSGAYDKFLNIEHRTSNIEHRTGVRGVTFQRSWPHFLYFSWGMLLGLGKLVKDVDVVHVHSNWTFPVWWGAWLALRQKTTLVMSPHGCFDPVRLKHSGWKKRLVGWMDRWLLRRASVVHATCGEEKRWVQAFLGKCANARMRECGNGSPRQGAAVPGECANAGIGECANGGGTPRQGESPRQGAAAPKPKILVIPNGVG